MRERERESAWMEKPPPESASLPMSNFYKVKPARMKNPKHDQRKPDIQIKETTVRCGVMAALKASTFVDTKCIP